MIRSFFKRGGGLSENCLLGKKGVHSIYHDRLSTLTTCRHRAGGRGGGIIISTHRFYRDDKRPSAANGDVSARGASVVDSTSRCRRRLCAFEKHTRATLTRALKIYHLARGAFHIVPSYACRIASSQLLMRSVLREAADYNKALFIFE